MLFSKKGIAKVEAGPGKRGQAPIEVIGITVMLIGLLALVMITSYGKNAETLALLEVSEDSIECSQISTTLGRMYTNRASTKETVFLFEEARLERVEGNPGGITVGTVNCEYLGNATLEGVPDVPDTDGITLVKATNWCFEKNGAEVRISEGECN